ncbi:hypothetical protein [Nesterenkonia sp. HG001]|uniref:hypothetical protein n=1 Tax=Nesterenkonia sp. HG001 TaxID=2983207 RepID=UPI002AC5F7B9|nr:hypothetical protein [Nesterenkonia sp. HG001]MDZ5076960.1 hypothetical protein [Nesterenkonia sp. HG001]
MAAQTRQPDAVIELSAETWRGPQDLSRSLRSRLLRDRGQASRTTNPGPGGSRVTSLWRHLERRLPDGFSPRPQWLWILPSDALPEPDALEQLEERLFTVTDEETHPQIQVIGAKQLHASGSAEEVAVDRLVDVGLWSARSGEVVPLSEPKELDQGQYDGRDAVPAVAAHGMLVHAPLFGDLGGFDPTLPPDAAAAQFCRRAREVGAHVVIRPAARIRRLDPTPREEVHRLGGALHLSGPERRGQIRRRLTESSPAAVPFLWIGQWMAAVLRTVLLTAVKAPDAAVGQLVSSAGALFGLGAIGHSRRFIRAGRRAVMERLLRDERIDSEHELLRSGRRAERELRLSSAELRRHRRRLMTAETVAPQRAGYGLAGARGDEEDDHDALLGQGSADGEFDEMPTRRSGDRLGLFLMLLGLTGLSLLVFRDLLPAEALIGGAALPVTAVPAEIAASMVSLISTDGLGQLSGADPFTLVLLILSVLSGGHASTVLVWLTVLALPLAALTAWLASRLVTARATVRVVAALLWAGVPSLHIALGEGRVGVVLAHVLMPLVVLTGARALGARPVYESPSRPGQTRSFYAASWEHAAAAALLLTVVTAAAPVLLVLTVVVCVVGALVLRGRGRVLWLLPLPSLALAAPMLGSAVLTGQNAVAVLLSDPTRPLVAAVAPLWQQLLGHSRPFDPSAGLFGATMPEFFASDFWSLRLALVVGAPLLLVALLGVVTATRRSSHALTAGVVLLAALGVSAAASRMAAGDDGVQLIPADVGPLVSVMAFCLLIAAVGSLDRLPRALPQMGPTLAPVAATLLVLSVIASLGSWAVPRALPGSQLSDESLTAVTPTETLIAPGQVRQVPATAADQGTGPAQLRTLVLDAGRDGVVGELVSEQGRTLDSTRAVVSAGDVPLWVEPAASARDLTPGDRRLGQLVAALVTPGSGEVGPLMEELGIGYVLIRSGEDSPLVDAVDTAGGLIAVGPTDRGLLWRAEVPERAEVFAVPDVEGASTAWARLVDEYGHTVALLPSQGRQVDVDLAELVDVAGESLVVDQDLVLRLATERASGWSAQLDGESLEPAPGGTWTQSFHVPAELLTGQSAGEVSGVLTAEHSSPYRWPLLILVGGLLLLVVLIAVPLPRGARLLPVATDAELARMDGRGEQS